MASKRKAKATELAAEIDPKARLDAAAFLSAAGPVLARLKEDLLARSEESPAVREALAAEHARDRAAERTGDSFAEWRGHFIDQVAAAWLLSCVFVRTLEDRGLLGHARIAGAGAQDSQTLFFELAPSLTERDYLLTVFRELTRFPAAAALFDSKHNPVWLLAPSAEAAKDLLALFRRPTPEAPAFRFGQADTRFLGDLYQDLDEGVRKRFALLQTPDFVESYILDKTLEPAIARFGLEETTLIDPTCGSGHFLLGAFQRLYDHRRRQEPNATERDAVKKALDAVAGADINPFAVAIARLRLTLAALEKAGYTKLAEAPALPLHLAVADSLLYNPQLPQLEIAHRDGHDAALWEGGAYALEDPAAARDVLHKQYAAVVGNPPYVTVKDPTLRERYRAMYPNSAGGKYSLAAPFAERFLSLARPRGFVGTITANSFMKREFGKKLIESVLPAWNLTAVVNTSGAFIPGHGTPTVLLFATAEPPVESDVHAVLAKRGEPTTPIDPGRGLVWTSIVEHGQELGFEDDYISVARVVRTTLAKHPWSLGGGGAAELKELLEDRGTRRLGDYATDIGFDAIMGEDELFFGPPEYFRRIQAADGNVRELCTGEQVRDWAIAKDAFAYFPYDERLLPAEPADSIAVREHFWRYRSVLIERRQFGKNTIEAGLKWFEYRSFYKAKRRTALSITFAFVATHNHFVLDRGGKVFNRSAPIIKLPESATEDDHLALLAYLNSSTACFWMKQVFYPKATSTGDISTEKGKPEANRYEFAGTGLQALPLPPLTPAQRSNLVVLARRAIELAAEREAWSAERWTARVEAGEAAGTLQDVIEQRESLLAELVAVQEEIDWLVYRCFGLSTGVPQEPVSARPDRRPYRATSIDDVEPRWCGRFTERNSVPELSLLEDALYKRPWDGTRGVFGHANKPFDEHVRDASSDALQLLGEQMLKRPEVRSIRAVATSLLADERALRLMELQGDGEPGQKLDRVLKNGDAVPFLSAQRFLDTGLAKHAEWQRTWDLQRREDRGERVGEIPVPPKYDSKDYRDQNYWRLRGKLDVPKERFISYPGCESDEDGEPLYGWPGWNHLQQAQALAALYNDRKDREGWTKDRLLPMLTGILELLPWVKQWHNEPSADFDGLRLGDYFEGFLQGQMRELGFTEDDLRAWRPARAAKAKKTAAKKKTKKGSEEPS